MGECELFFLYQLKAKNGKYQETSKRLQNIATINYIKHLSEIEKSAYNCSQYQNNKYSLD